MLMLQPAYPRRRGWSKTQNEICHANEPLCADAVNAHILD
jgi:hypothetical protein